MSANAYLGAAPIAEALSGGADIVITGRASDPALFLAPMIHAFGWAMDDWNLLGQGTVAGHLLECAGQITGGYFADPGYKDVADLARLGFPIGEVGEDGSLVITKVAGSGGAVTARTCKEQLLYEVHDPRRYLQPDVTADFSQVEEIGPDRVRVSGGRGTSRPDTLKVSVGYVDSFIGEGQISYAGPGAFARTGAMVKTEDDPFDPDPPAAMRRTVEAMAYLEQAILGADGIDATALRYGGFYGPGTGLGEGGPQLEAVRRRRYPIVSAGTGVSSFTHIDDVAAATVLAIESGATGLYNIVDDDPAAVAEWLPALAEAIGAKPPRHVPAWLGRLFAGELGVIMMTESRGASNAKAKRELGWQPMYPTWRIGFRTGLGKAVGTKAA